MNFDANSVVILEGGKKYYAEVVEAGDHVSRSSGKESIKLTFDLWQDVAKVGQLPVYMTPSFAKIFKHGIIAMLGEEKFKSGNVCASDFIGKNCIVLTGTEFGEFEGRQTEKVVIRDIFAYEGNKNTQQVTSPQSASQQQQSNNDDDLPF